ncbi:hypothetical protein L596_023862 [Steinernema carpocapsae]|uniref:Uncharacterized protein n=1 Tax=Steinernema carpocapsae TaxID=34508 RepID=A0A4U5MF09_STECR|nr:hypothetical protein L596_023862 [Steinernema carpocapsae]
MVCAKPIVDKFAKKLGESYGRGKDFVVGSAKSKRTSTESSTSRGETAEGTSSERPLTTDEKKNAKIRKAEWKGDRDLVAKLNRGGRRRTELVCLGGRLR